MPAAQSPQNPPTLSAQAPRGAPLSFADLAARLQPAVVNVSTTQKVRVSGGGSMLPGFPSGTPFDEFFRQFGGGGGGLVTRNATSLGSGFIISPDGYIVTNNHVVSGDAQPGAAAPPVESITVTLPDRREFKARLVGRDVPSDLALLKIDASGLPFVRWGNSKEARVGDWVLAIGNPFALGGTVTAGIISALHRNINNGLYDRYIQTDAAINRGNSGGPMFDLRGNVIGINTAIYSPTGGNVGIGFAIPAEQARPVIDTLMRGGKVHRGYLGVTIQPVTKEIASALALARNQGAIVAKTEPGYAADRAGIRQGDVIVGVGGQPVTADNTLSYAVANLPVGSRVPIDLVRNGKRMTITVVLGERPPESVLASRSNEGGLGTAPDESTAGQAVSSGLGLAVMTMTPRLAEQLGVPPSTRGLVIDRVDPSSDAAQSGLQRGDIILSINQRPAVTPADVTAAVAAARGIGRPSVLLLVRRGNRPAHYVAVKLAPK
jgi:serine protease Do